MAEAETPHDKSKPTHYVVVRATGTITDSAVNQLAARLRLKPEELIAALATSAPVPLAAFPSENDANQVAGELGNAALQAVSVSEGALKNNVSPIILRVLEFADSGLTAVSKNGRERVFANWPDLSLIVTGRLLTHRVEVDERRSGSAVKPLDRREFTDDKSIIDLYSVSCEAPWRIVVSDFDFSCLAERKGLTAFDNAATLIRTLMDRSNAEWNDSYGRVKAALAHVWPLQNTTRESRSRRPRAGRKDFATVNASSNETQFNNYSRLVWCLKLRELQSPGPDRQGEPGL